MPIRLLPALALVAAVALGGCTQTARTPAAPPPGSAPPGVTPSTFHMPEGTGCAGEVARFKAVLDNDVAVGHLTRSVHGRASADADRAGAACSAGRDGEARSQLAATRARYGYP